MTITAVISEKDRLVRLHNSHKHESFVEQNKDFSIYFKSINNFQDSIKIELSYGEKSDIYLIDKNNNVITVPMDYLKYPGFDIRCIINERKGEKTRINLVKTNTISIVENVNSDEDLEKMYKYATICNQILKEC